MNLRLTALTAAILISLPAVGSAQGFGVAARAGTMGIGAEAAVGVGSMLAFRGGMGLIPFSIDASRFWDLGPDVNVRMKLPKTWYNLGVDLIVGGGFRIGAGILFKPDDATVSAALAPDATIDVGGQTYTGSDVGEILGTLNAKNQAPYGLIGFGNQVRSGVGLFLDVGLAFLGDPAVTLESRGGDPAITDSAEFKQRLAEEERNLNNDLPSWAKKYWPIVNLGIKVGLGG